MSKVSYVEQFKKQFAHIIPKFNASGRYSFTWKEKVLIEQAYVEMGGHAICKTCGNEVMDTLNRIIYHVKQKPNPKVVNINTPLPADAEKKDAVQRAKELGVPMPRNISRVDLITLVNNHINGQPA